MLENRLSRPLVGFIAFWLMGIAVMTWRYVANPVDPSLHGTDRYGTTYAGELRFILLVTLIEICISLGVLRPWSYRRSWIRALIVLVLVTPWLMLWGALGLHAGPTTHVHTLWLMLYWVALLAATVVSGVAAARAHSLAAAGGLTNAPADDRAS